MGLANDGNSFLLFPKSVLLMIGNFCGPVDKSFLISMFSWSQGAIFR
jgi:hypothetical protein